MKDLLLKLISNTGEVLHNFQNDLPLLPKRMKTEKAGKLVANLYDID